MKSQSVFEVKYGKGLCDPLDCHNWRWSGHPSKRWFLSAYAESLQFTRPLESPSLLARGANAFWADIAGRTWVWRSYIFRQRAAEELEPRFYGFAHFWEHPQIEPRLKCQSGNAHSKEHPSNEEIEESRLLVAEAYLSPPERMRRPHYYILQLPATSFYDVLPTPVTPFCMPWVYAFGLCSHCVAHSALVLSTPFGAVPQSLVDLAWLAHDCDGMVRTNVKLQGLDLHQIANAIGGWSQFTRCGAAIEVFEGAASRDTVDPDNAIGSMICDSLVSGLPVIAMVNSKAWFEKAYEDSPGNVAEKLRIDCDTHPNHCILIVGFHPPVDGQDLRFVCHDPAVGPFSEIRLAGLIHSMAAYSNSLADSRGDIAFIVPRPVGALRSFSGVRNYYLSEVLAPSERTNTDDQIRLRLLHKSEFNLAYQRQLAWGSWGGKHVRWFNQVTTVSWQHVEYFIGLEDLAMKRILLFDASNDRNRCWGWFEKRGDRGITFSEARKGGDMWKLPERCFRR